MLLPVVVVETADLFWSMAGFFSLDIIIHDTKKAGRHADFCVVSLWIWSSLSFHPPLSYETWTQMGSDRGNPTVDINSSSLWFSNLISCFMKVTKSNSDREQWLCPTSHVKKKPKTSLPDEWDFSWANLTLVAGVKSLIKYKLHRNSVQLLNNSNWANITLI